MSQYWTDRVRRLTPYVPGEQRSGAHIVKLNTNENPYPPPQSVLDAIAAVGADALRRYPDPESRELRDALAAYHGLSADRVFVGNGSDEVLALAFLAFFTGGKALQYPEISYSFYPVYCDLYGISPRTVPLDAEFGLSLDAFGPGYGGIVFPNPNAPTGRAVAVDEIAALLQRCRDQLVLVDEAYVDFSGDSAVRLIDAHPNLLVVQTFSKGRSLAGMRIGMAFGQADLIEALVRVKDSFNSYPLDAIAQTAAKASLQDEPAFRAAVASVCETREWISAALMQRRWTVLPSAANFVFASPHAMSAEAVFQALGDAGVLVRYWNKPRLENWLRISIGTDDEMQALLDVIDSLAPDTVPADQG